MKKIVILLSAALLFFSVNAQAAVDTSLMSVRNKIFDESKIIKGLMKKTQDIVIMSAIWDTCIITTSNLDAYFHMLGIFNAMKEADITGESVDYLIKWLERIRGVNQESINSLSGIPNSVEQDTKVHGLILLSYLENLNQIIDGELSKLALLKQRYVVESR